MLRCSFAKPHSAPRKGSHEQLQNRFLHSEQFHLRVEHLRIDGQPHPRKSCAAIRSSPPAAADVLNSTQTPTDPEIRRRLVHRRGNRLGLELHCSSLVVGKAPANALASTLPSPRRPSIWPRLATQARVYGVDSTPRGGTDARLDRHHGVTLHWQARARLTRRIRTTLR